VGLQCRFRVIQQCQDGALRPDCPAHRR
jgi:hypothetical protein